ncbi:MAG: response regulator [Gemmataceae bacterium]
MPSKDAVNILVVDDMPEKLMAMESILESLDQNVIQVNSGRDALRHLLEKDFAVILLDVNMPDMDGLETAAMIRRHKRCSNTPIIFITAYPDEMLTAQGYSLGAVDYILSPVVPEILRTKVSVFVDLFKKTEQVKQHAEERLALQREQLARAAAEEANRKKDEFLAVLSHELRNPLAPIRNALHIFRLSKLENPMLEEARNVMERQVQQLGMIVDDLLDVFRIATRKIELTRETVDLSELVRLAVEDHRASLTSDRRKLVVQVAQDPVWASIDRRRISQVLSNLLHNAVKFTNAGDEITIKLESDLLARQCLITVRDTGIGISEELLPKIFEIFTQGEQGIDRKRGGLGLGLALVKGLVELQGGSVRVASRGVGQGAEVGIILPLVNKSKDKVRPISNNVSSGVQQRILIIEDNCDSASTLRALLECYGHHVETAHSGPAGVRAAREFRPDVVLCDLGLPEMDGFQVAGVLRRDPITASSRLIAVSGYGQEEDRRRSKDAGFDLHLTKPVDPATLQSLLAVDFAKPVMAAPL